jgi:hypothetical protein
MVCGFLKICDSQVQSSRLDMQKYDQISCQAERKNKKLERKQLMTNAERFDLG